MSDELICSTKFPYQSCNEVSNSTFTVWSSEPLTTFSCMLNTAELTAFECPWNTLTEWMGGARKSHNLWCC